MTDLEEVLRSNRGVVSRGQLTRRGYTDADVKRFIRAGALQRLRNGWFCTSFADPLVREAVTAGGILTCVSALRRHDVWTPQHSRGLHVRVANRALRRTSADRCRLHGPIPPPSGAVDDIADSIRYAARCLDSEGLVVVCDSVLNAGLLTAQELTTALAPAPQRVRDLLHRCDGRAQSGTETMVRLRLRSRKIGVAVQHSIAGVGVVDLLVGNRIVIEVDSVAHHTGIERYESDRTRDRLLVELGYVPLRLTYRQVVHDWADCERTILHLVRNREHRRVPRSG